MDKDPYHHQRFANEPSVSVSPWYPQQPSTVNPSYDVVLVQPGHSDELVNGNTEKIRDYTLLSVFTTICCCFPIGICALINARSSKTLLALGRRQEALESSIISRNVNISAMIVGPIVSAVFVILKIYVFSHVPDPYHNYNLPR